MNVSTILVIINKSASSTNASAYTLTPLSNSTVNNRVTQSGPLADDTSFQFVDVRDLD